MTVRYLIEVLSAMDPATPVLLDGPEHGYAELSRITVTTALHGSRCWHEDHGEDMTPKADYGPRVNVIVLRR